MLYGGFVNQNTLVDVDPNLIGSSGMVTLAPSHLTGSRYAVLRVAMTSFFCCAAAGATGGTGELDPAGVTTVELARSALPENPSQEPHGFVCSWNFSCFGRHFSSGALSAFVQTIMSYQ
jgi:hypothetical protein